MLNRYLIGAGLAVGLLAGAWFHGHHHGKQAAELVTALAWLESAEAARKIEQKRQGAANAALKKQNEELAGINARLIDDVARLQQRPARPSLSEAGRPACSGASGAELSGPDAGFLAREAARADRLRAALTACYSIIDHIAP